MTEQLSNKVFYGEAIVPGQPFSSDLVKDCYSVFACRHKFCREVCPVYQEGRNEANTAYGFHSALLMIAKGIGELADLRGTITNCLECGACELRCPNTLYGGDFYRTSTTNIDLVRKVRRDMVAAGIHFEGYDKVESTVASDVRHFDDASADLMRWADDLDLPRAGETMLFVDYFNALQTTEVPRLAAKILRSADVSFGILEHPAPSLGELLDIDLEAFVDYARHNIEGLKKAGAKRVIIISPHDYSYFTRDYPAHLGELPFEVTFITDEIARLLTAGKIKFHSKEKVRVSYHDPCTLNKICGITRSPRDILAAIPGVEFVDVDPVTQWSYCCGNGNASYRHIHPDTSYRIGAKRLRQAADLGVEQLVVACPRCKDQFTDVKTRSGIPIEPIHVLERLAQAMGLR